MNSTIIKTDGKEIYIGRFDTIEEATYARLVAEELYHGEFRRAA